MSEVKQESTRRTLLVALMVCLVCSVVVAGAAVGLKPAQVINRELDKQRNILSIAHLADAAAPAAEVQRIFKERIQPRLVDLDAGRFSDAQDAATFDALKAAQDPALSAPLAASDDIASIRRRERYSVVYLVEDADRGPGCRRSARRDARAGEGGRLRQAAPVLLHYHGNRNGRCVCGEVRTGDRRGIQEGRGGRGDSDIDVF